MIHFDYRSNCLSAAVKEGRLDPETMKLTVHQLRRLHLDVSFEIQDGECVSLAGPSGSGKTLLLRALADLDPAEGTVCLDGVDRSSIPAPLWRRQVGYVAAEPGWWADRVIEHFSDWPRARGLIERLGLTASCGNWPVDRLSTGERQRLALIRALLLKPRVLLLDEPTAALDPVATSQVEALIAEERQAGLGVLWVTHDAAQAKRVSSRKLELRDDGIAEVTA